MSEKNAELNDAELARVTGGLVPPNGGPDLTIEESTAISELVRALLAKQARKRAEEALRRQLADQGVPVPRL